MKKLYLFSCICFILGACNDKSKTVSFNLAYKSTATVTASYGSTIPFTVQSTNVITQIKTEANNYKTTPALITSVIVKQIQLLVLTPTGSNFDYMDDINLYISADGLDKTLIGQLTNMPQDGATVKTLKLKEGVDISTYIQLDEFYTLLEITPNNLEYMDKNQDLDIHLTLAVIADKP